MDLAHLNSIGLPTESFATALGAASCSSGSKQPAPAVASKSMASGSSAVPKEADVKKPSSAPQVPAVAPAKAAPAPASVPASGSGGGSSSSSAGAAAPRTEPVFLKDTFLFELQDCETLEAVLSPDALEGGKRKLTVVLNKTIFHPQGGGQPADTGLLLADGLPQLPVTFVSMRKDDGAVLHDCTAEQAVVDAWVAAAAAGKVRAMCRIDEAKRRLAARLHSAGHLLDAAVSAVGLKWIPGKGYHFHDGPYVEYMLNDESKKIDPKKSGDKEQVIADIQSNINRLVAAGGPVLVEYKDGLRHVAMAGEECPCGGTHVKDLSEIGAVEVKKLQNKQGNVRLSYTVAAAA